MNFFYYKETRIIKITKNRKVFTDPALGYTCIEIFDSDKINKFFNIDEIIFNEKESIKNKEIFLLHYLNGNLSHAFGKIIDINNDIIKHDVFSENISSGSPLIKRYNNNLILGINGKNDFNSATPFDVIIKNIISQIINNQLVNLAHKEKEKDSNFKKVNKLDHKKKIENENIINLIYYNNEGQIRDCRVFGDKFVENNYNNITVIINGKKNFLQTFYELNQGKNSVQIIIKKPLTNLSEMFRSSYIYDIEELKKLNTEKVRDFSKMFFYCNSLSDINALQNWNVSNGENFEGMFDSCHSLSDINALQNWNVSNGKNFEGMFSSCKSLSNIKPLENWNVSNGEIFMNMFSSCESLSNIKPLKNWNVSNGKDFYGMFAVCKSLSNINPLEFWNVSNGEIFMMMFSYCFQLSNVYALKYWNVSNGYKFGGMFKECKSLSDIYGLQNWNVSNGKYFNGLFEGCKSLSDIKPLEKWDVSNVEKFDCMFKDCSSLSNIKPIENWDVSNGDDFEYMFSGCKDSLGTKPLKSWNFSKEKYLNDAKKKWSKWSN